METINLEAEQLNKQGCRHLRDKRLTSAAELFGRAVATAPENAAYLNNLGVTLYQLGQYEAAESHFLKAISHDPTFHASYFHLAHLALHRDRPEESKRYAEQAVAYNADEIEYIAFYSEISWKVGDLDSVSKAYSRILELDPNFPRINLLVGELLLLLREYSSAEKRLHFALQKGDQPLYRVYRGLGRTALGQGKYGSARQLFEKALSLYPEDVVSLCGLGYVELGESRMEVAHDLFRKALTVEPDHADSLFGLALLSNKRSDTEKARALAEKVDRLHPYHAPAKRLLAELYAGNGDRGLAKEKCQEIIALLPSSGEASFARQLINALDLN